MPRAATSSDVFNAVAEPQRRAILDFLVDRARPVGDVAEALKLAQPSVSKHLRVLREVGLVTARREGRHQFYQLNALGLKPVHDWTRTFERFWTHQLDRIRQRAERKARERSSGKHPQTNDRENP